MDFGVRIEVEGKEGMSVGCVRLCLVDDRWMEGGFL